MVSVVHSVAAQSDLEQSLLMLGDLLMLGEGLAAAEVERLQRAVDFARSIYGHRLLGSAEDVWGHAPAVPRMSGGTHWEWR